MNADARMSKISEPRKDNKGITYIHTRTRKKRRKRNR